MDKTYLIKIDDEQRQALLEILNGHQDIVPGHALEFWVEMLTELPTDNMEGMIHGFCI